MAPKLYMINGSPYVRAVLITAKAIGLQLDHHEVDFTTAAHLSPEYLKINPQHTVPALDDNGNTMWDSHAIITYLVGKYGTDDTLYPKDLYERALVDQRLHFESGVLSPSLHVIDVGYMNKEIREVAPKLIEHVKEGYAFLEKFLEGKRWVAVDHVTVADFSILPTILSLDVHVKVDPKTYPNITSWIKRLQALPCLEGDEQEQKAFADWISVIRPTVV